MPILKSRSSLKKAGKRIYKQEYNKAKAEALRKARKRSREQIKAAARKKANAKYNRTTREKTASRKKKIAQFAATAKRMSENMIDGFESDNKKAYSNQAGKNSKKKQGKSIWDMDFSDIGF